MESPIIRLAASAALKERRLETLLAGREPGSPGLQAAVEAAQIRGSLELAGFTVSREEALAAQRGEAAPEAAHALMRARRAVDPGQPFTLRGLLAWHAASVGGGGLRSADRARPGGPATAPAAAVPARLAIVEQWLNEVSARELRPAQQGALVLARLVEIAPFDDGNGRVSRLACSHLMVRAGARPPILEGSDRVRLDEALQAAFALHTEPLVGLLDEASGRALDVMIRALEEVRT